MLRSLNGKIPEIWMDSGSNPGGVESCGCEVPNPHPLNNEANNKAVTLG